MIEIIYIICWLDANREKSNIYMEIHNGFEDQFVVENCEKNNISKFYRAFAVTKIIYISYAGWRQYDDRKL